MFNNIIRNKQYYFKFGLTALCFATVFYLIHPFFFSIAIAGVFALVLNPLVIKLQQLLHNRNYLTRRLCVAFLLLCFCCIVVAPVSVFIYKFFSYANSLTVSGIKSSGFYKNILEFETKVLGDISGALKKLGMTSVNMDDVSGNSFDWISSKIILFSTLIISSIPDVSLSIVVFFVALYFFLLKSRALKSQLMNFKLFTHLESEKLIKGLRDSANSILIASIITGVVQAFIISLGAFVFSVGDFFMIFVLVFLCSFIPIFGTGPIGILLAALCFVRKDYTAFWWMLALVGFAATVDNVIRAYVVSFADDNLHPGLLFLTVLGAVYTLGIPGLILGPFILSASLKVYGVLLTEPPKLNAEEDKPLEQQIYH